MLFFKKRKFKVKLKGRAGILYIEGEREININSELLLRPYGILIYKSSIKNWNPPHNDELIDDIERNRILNNVVSDFEKLKYRVEIAE